MNLEEKENTAEVAPEAAAQATNQAVQENNAQDAGVQETAGAAAPQEQPVKKSQNRRPAQKKTASKEQGGNGEAQKKKNTGSRQGQAKSRSGQKGENQTQETSRKIVGDLLSPSDLAVLVVPIDKAAPKGRLILPQQQTIRDILEADAVSVVVRENGLRDTLASLGKKPRMVITDSQVFAKVSADTPEDILLTSFSILFARYKGSLEPMVRGVRALDRIGKGDRILICEGCTHHRQCEDIGTVKLPGWIREYTGTEPEFVFTSGTEFPDDLAGFRLIVHCGGCMLNEREMKYRMKCAHDQGIPITNYGITIAYVQGILRRSVEPFPEIAALLCGSREG